MGTEAAGSLHRDGLFRAAGRMVAACVRRNGASGFAVILISPILVLKSTNDWVKSVYRRSDQV